MIMKKEKTKDIEVIYDKSSSGTYKKRGKSINS